MKVLITGSSGFIGNNLARELEGAGHEVIGADKVAPVSRPLYQPEVLAHVDLQESVAFSAILQEYKPDAVIHLAAQVGRLFGEDDIRHTVKTNAEMTTVIASECGKRNVKLFYASSSEIYGDNGEEWCDEYDGPFSLPHNLYGVTKRWGEEACQLYAPDGLVIMRFSMPYGPGVPPGRGRAALPNFLWQAANGMDIPVHRGAERSWCWIGDTVRGVRLILEADAEGPFNIGRSDDARPMEALATEACLLTGASHDRVKIIEPPAAQTVVKRLKTERLEALGWQPEVDIHDGMAMTLSWVKDFNARGEYVGDATDD